MASELKGGATVGGYKIWHGGNLNPTDYYKKTELQTSGQSQVHWGNITNKPTTLSGAGITDVYTKTELQTSGSASVHWNNLTNKPTYDNYGSWTLKVNTDAGQTVLSGGVVDLKGSGATSITRSGNTLTISSTDNNNYVTGISSTAGGNGTLTLTRSGLADLTINLAHTHSLTTSDVTGLGTAATKNTGTTSGTIPILDSNGKLDTSVLPALAITDTFVVATQAAMLALTAEVGDVAVRTDLNKSFILKTSPASTLTNWQELLTPTDAVTSVAGKTGAVTLNSSDVGLGNVTNESKATMFTSPTFTGTVNAFSGKTIDLSPSVNSQAIKLRAGSNWDSAIGHDNAGAETMSFMMKSSGSTFKFKTGFDPATFAQSTFVPMTNADLEIGSGYAKINGATVWHSNNFNPANKADTSSVYTKTNLQTSGQASVHWDNVTNKVQLLPYSSNGIEDLGTPGTYYNAVGYGPPEYEGEINLIRVSSYQDGTFTVYVQEIIFIEEGYPPYHRTGTKNAGDPAIYWGGWRAYADKWDLEYGLSFKLTGSIGTTAPVSPTVNMIWIDTN